MPVLVCVFVVLSEYSWLKLRTSQAAILLDSLLQPHGKWLIYFFYAYFLDFLYCSRGMTQLTADGTGAFFLARLDF